MIARHGRPVARLVPIPRRPARRSPGDWRGKVWMAPDFDHPLGDYEHLVDDWYGEATSAR